MFPCSRLGPHSLWLLAALALAGPSSAQISFTSIGAGLPGVRESSVAWGDYDSDGDLDIFLAGDTAPGYRSAVFRNDGAGGFHEVAVALPGLNYAAAAWGDYDNDDDLDLVLSGDTGSGYSSEVYRNDGPAGFQPIGAGLMGLTYPSVAWGDYDNDGDLDLLHTGYGGYATYISRVYRNDGAGGFHDIEAGLTGIAGGSAVWGDYDNDGDLDIALAGTSLTGPPYEWPPLTKIYRNDAGSFADIGATLHQVSETSLAWGDWDNDGDLDILLTGHTGTTPRTRVYRNDGAEVFQEIPVDVTQIHDGSVAWGDYDNDGDLDILITGDTTLGFISEVFYCVGQNYISHNAGLVPVAKSSVAWGDYDNDGDLDILLAGETGILGVPIAAVYRNDGAPANMVPLAPSNLADSIYAAGNQVMLSWWASTDGQTPAAALTYNVRVGVTPGGNEICAAMSDTESGFRRVVRLGNAQHRTWWTLNLPPDSGTYYWSVQAVDGAFAGSAFAAEETFTLDLTPPTGSLPASSGTAGTQGTIRANWDGASSSTLFYRIGGEQTFRSTAMTEESAGQWVGAIPSSAMTVKGVQYYVEANDGVNSAVLPDGAPSAALANMSVAVSNHAALNTGVETYALAGIMLAAQNSAPTSVFAQLGDYDRSVWRYGTYDPGTDTYREPDQSPGSAPATPGQGFWIITRDAATITVSGHSTNLGQNVSLVLQPGFNQVANPFAFPVRFADLIRPSEVQDNLIGWNGTGYAHGLTTLEPARGYWLNNTGSGSATIEIPPLGAPPAPRGLRGSPGVLVQGDVGWSVHVQASAGKYLDCDNRFGMRRGATCERDVFDFSDAPPPPAGYVTLSFLCDDGHRLLTDYRPENPEGAVWKLSFASDQVGESYRILFSPDCDLPAGWVLTAFEGKGVCEIDLLEHGEIVGTAGTSTQGRVWSISAGTPQYVESVRRELRAGVTAFRFGRPFPHPSGSPSFDLEVAREVDVRIRVYDVGGRLVRTLLDDRRTQGAYRITWDGTDRNGVRAAAGVYFVKVQAGEFAGSRKVVLLD